MTISPTVKRWVRIGSVLFLVATAITWGVTRPAHAGTYTAGCSTHSKSWYVSEGGVALRVFTITARGTACWNTQGALTSTNLTVGEWLTGPGKLAGWEVWERGGPYQVMWGNLSAWRQDGSVHLCIPVPYFPNVLCSYTEDWRVGMQFIAPRANPSGHVVYKQSAWCTNSKCALKFNSQP